MTSRYSFGTNIFDKKWDLLVILDTCRVDTLTQLSEERSWIDSVNQIKSVGSMSPEWILNTFTHEYSDEIRNTAFVSGNIWSHRIFNDNFHLHRNHEYNMIHRGYPSWDPVSSGEFKHYETVSAVANQDDRVHPENEAIPHILTDRAINVGRKINPDRLIVHYTLPHLTFIADAIDWKEGKLSTNELMSGPDPTRELRPHERSYEPVERGVVPRKTVQKSYTQNLRLALDYVNVLRRNIDAETAIISADHGEGHGEYGVWGHPYGSLSPYVRNVPWAEFTASDQGTYSPQYAQLQRSPTAAEKESFLENMGYL